MIRLESVIILAIFLSKNAGVAPEEGDITDADSLTSLEHTIRSPALTSKMPPEITLNNSQKEKRISHLDNPQCPKNKACSELSGDCLTCCFNYSCIYGDDINVSCHVNDSIICQRNENEPKYFSRTMKCQYCYQSDLSDYHCEKSTSCRVNGAVAQTYITKCKVKDNILCLGSRVFYKNIKCNYTRGYSWSVAMLLSVILGGFGVDRFYLGMWQEGTGKLFSFGGLGVWTLVDVILIATGYLGPADGSVFIY